MGEPTNTYSPYKRAGAQRTAVNSNGRGLSKMAWAKVQSSATGLDTLPNREVVKALNSAISTYEAKIGLRERNIKVADIGGGDYGVTGITTNGSNGVYLNRQFFSGKKKDIERVYKESNYATGLKNVTNRAIKHTITHELAHATWTDAYSKPHQKAAGKEIKALFKTWKADTKKKGYGSYGTKDVNEFFAEGVTKALHGKQDKYTRKLLNIVNKYNL